MRSALVVENNLATILKIVVLYSLLRCLVPQSRQNSSQPYRRLLMVLRVRQAFVLYSLLIALP
tara:strand:+ start:534 stop:722 length:189 start_codon:yes stop_codon:yes gene_type:complete